MTLYMYTCTYEVRLEKQLEVLEICMELGMTHCCWLVGLSIFERPIVDHDAKAHVMDFITDFMKSSGFHTDFMKSGGFHTDFTMKSGRFHEIHEIQWISGEIWWISPRYHL